MSARLGGKQRRSDDAVVAAASYGDGEFERPEQPGGERATRPATKITLTCGRRGQIMPTNELETPKPSLLQQT